MSPLRQQYEFDEVSIVFRVRLDAIICVNEQQHAVRAVRLADRGSAQPDHIPPGVAISGVQMCHGLLPLSASGATFATANPLITLYRMASIK